MKIAYFDCLSGISGNMTLGAMLACGLSRETLIAGLDRLHVPGWTLHAEPVVRRGIAATHVTVEEHPHHHHGHDADHHHHQHPHRGLGDILKLIDASDLSDRVKTLSSAIFTRLGVAEAAVHGTTPDQVHFHEVGAIDAIVDIVGTAIGIEALGIERVIASPLPLGRGWITCAHGIFPVPAPATAALVKDVPIVETDIEAELVTPTGAAIITTLAERFGPLPGMTIATIGYGAGSRDLLRPNVMRLFIGEATTLPSATEIVGLETNLDDVPGEVLGYLMDRLLAAGALDVFYTPIQMKKNRPGVLVSVLCAPADESACTGILFAETTALGVRRQAYARAVLDRALVQVETPYGSVRVKRSQWGDIVRLEPEYEDCRQLAEERQVPLRVVDQAARRAAGDGQE